MGQTDAVGQLLDSGLTIVQRLKQRDPLRLRHYPKPLGGQLNDLLG